MKDKSCLFFMQLPFATMVSIFYKKAVMHKKAITAKENGEKDFVKKMGSPCRTIKWVAFKKWLNSTRPNSVSIFNRVRYFKIQI